MRKIGILLVFGVFTVFSWPAAAGAIMIGFTPPEQEVNIGESVDVDILISGLQQDGLDEIVSAYSLVIGYDEAVLSVSDVAFGTHLGFSFADFDPAYNPGQLFVSELSLSLDSELADAQPDSFILATITFDALAEGDSDLLFLDYLNFGIDVKGRAVDFIPQILPVDADGGNIVVTDKAAPIPEPTSVMLLGFSLYFCGLLARRQRRQT